MCNIAYYSFECVCVCILSGCMYDTSYIHALLYKIKLWGHFAIMKILFIQIYGG